jgi:hypothetical protein
MFFLVPETPASSKVPSRDENSLGNNNNMSKLKKKLLGSLNYFGILFVELLEAEECKNPLSPVICEERKMEGSSNISSYNSEIMTPHSNSNKIFVNLFNGEGFSTPIEKSCLNKKSNRRHEKCDLTSPLTKHSLLQKLHEVKEMNQRDEDDNYTVTGSEQIQISDIDLNSSDIHVSLHIGINDFTKFYICHNNQLFSSFGN